MKYYRFQLNSSGGSFKLFVMLSGASFEDLTGIWRCLPGNLAVDNGGCFYYEPYRTLTLYDKAEFSKRVVKDAVLIARLRVPYKWVHMLDGDEGDVRFYPYGARMAPSSLSDDGWLKGQGRFTAEHGFGGSWARIILDSAKGADRSAIK
jgi:hypothetical protein